MIILVKLISSIAALFAAVCIFGALTTSDEDLQRIARCLAIILAVLFLVCIIVLIWSW